MYVYIYIQQMEPLQLFMTFLLCRGNNALLISPAKCFDYTRLSAYLFYNYIKLRILSVWKMLMGLTWIWLRIIYIDLAL